MSTSASGYTPVILAGHRRRVGPKRSSESDAQTARSALPSERKLIRSCKMAQIALMSAKSANIFMLGSEVCTEDMGSLKQRWAARLISAAVALALVFASAVGAYSHALAQCHYGHAHTSQHQDYGTAPVVSSMEHRGEPQKAPTTNHATCGDTICHGGYAIGGQVTLTLPLSQSTPPISVTRADAGAKPPSLDRPPRSPVLA